MILKLDDQVCSLEYVKILRELGVKQESLFYWHNIDIVYPSVIYGDYTEWSGDRLISAFTVAEIGELLPSVLYSYTASGSDKCLIFNKYEDVFHVGYRNVDNNFMIHFSVSKNEADARAKMLICLIENNLVTKEWKQKWLIAA